MEVAGSAMTRDCLGDLLMFVLSQCFLTQTSRLLSFPHSLLGQAFPQVLVLVLQH